MAAYFVAERVISSTRPIIRRSAATAAVYRELL